MKKKGKNLSDEKGKGKKKDDSPTTDTSTMPPTQKEAVTLGASTATTAPLITVGGERVPVMVIYKGKKASRSMVEDLLGRKRETAEPSEASTKSPAVSEPSPTPKVRARRFSKGQTLVGALLLALMVIGLIIAIAGIGLYATHKDK